MAGMANKPRAYTCYLCGQQYGSRSLHIHIPQCQKMWEEREAQKPDKRERRPVPEAPPEMSEPLPSKGNLIDEFNNKMADYWNRASLVGCPTCGRTFRPEALERHASSCKGESPGGRRTSVSPGKGPGMSTPQHAGAAAAPKSTSKPKGYTCYLCGQQYGSKRCVHATWQRHQLA
eukprot:evm.model.scf_2885.1 EVM.evm.TU.scf_2885.1   scf_2885:6075-7782(+)